MKDNFALYLYGVQTELLGDLSSARQLYDMSVLRDDSSIYIPSLLSSINLRLLSGDYGSKTEEYLNLASKSGVDEQTLTDLMINFKLGKEQYSDVKSICNKLLLNDSSNKRLYSILAVTDFYCKNLDSSLYRINEYESKFGVDPHLYTIKREILSNMSLYDSLLSYNQRVSDLYPENLSISADLANVYAAVGDDSTAFSIWKSIENEDSTSIELLASRNFFYTTRGYKNEAISTTSQLLASPFIKTTAKQEIFSQLFLTIDVKNDSLYFPLMDSLFYKASTSETDTCTVVREIVLGYFFYRKNYNSSLDILSSLYKSLPQNPLYTTQRAYIYSLKGKLDSSYMILDSAILASPFVSDFPLYKAELLNKYSSVQDSYKFIQQSIKQQSQDTVLSSFYSYLADIDYKAGNIKKAFKNYEKSLSYNPDNTLALNNYAYFLALSDLKLDYALGMSHKCNTLDKMNPTYLDTEAYILFKLGRFKEAKDMMDLVFSLSQVDPSDEVLLHYADILSALGNYIQAKEYYKRALNAGADKSLIDERLNTLK